MISLQEYAAAATDTILANLDTGLLGLTHKEAEKRNKLYGLNLIHKNKINLTGIFFRQFTGNPLILILAAATLVSYFLGQQISSYYIFGLIFLSVFLGLFNEYSAEKTVEGLLKSISHNALVIRDGEKAEIPVSSLTLGDVVLLSEGTVVPADVRLVSVKDLEVNEAIITGESKTIFKREEVSTIKSADLSQFLNISFMGSGVQSGSGKGVVIGIGKETEFGKIAQAVTYIKPTTEFQKGLSEFGQLIVGVIIILTIVIFAVNALLGHKLLESALFSLAIAVGLTPELLPVIVTVSLSHGAGKLAKRHVVAKRLISVENLGNMDILCADKTGTLTEGKITVTDYIDVNGNRKQELLNLALLCNSAVVHHKVLGNAIDVAIWEYANKNDLATSPLFKKIDEVPFDYVRKAMYCVITVGNKHLIVAKGEPEIIISYCHEVEDKKALQDKFVSLSKDGQRVIGLASKEVTPKSSYGWADVKDLKFEGYVTFLDSPKKFIREALNKFQSLNVVVKIVTGDNELVTKRICEEVGFNITGVVLGSELEKCQGEALKNIVNNSNVFARVTPLQKLKIVQTLQGLGHTVGFLGDGVNDVPAIHSADVGISVNTGADVAKEGASIVLLRKGLNVISDGIVEGRKTFNNTVKYILMATSSNFGNMFSAAGASFFLPFLPMTPLQILLTNGLYDISQLSLPSDNVDPESLLKPRHWNISFIKNYMIFFGPLSSVFDFLTFGVMLFVFKAHDSLFQTGWFIESLATEILVVFVIRTSRTPFFKSLPGKWLTFTCLALVAIGVVLPFTPLSKPLGFVIPPPGYFGILVLLVSVYLFLVETVKTLFLKKYIL